jgi:hypothetical protein
MRTMGRRATLTAAWGMAGLKLSGMATSVSFAQGSPESSPGSLVIGDQHVTLFSPAVLRSVGMIPHPGGGVVAGVLLNNEWHGGLYGTTASGITLPHGDHWAGFEVQLA